MGRMGEDLDFKSQLVLEICSFSSRSTSCRHFRFQNPNKSPLIDWYLLLHVKEDADTEIIKKQYRKLALQLHPDKNNHPKAGIAFKLVSQAYACLSDKTKRVAFDFERSKSFCTHCSSAKFPSVSEVKLQGSDTRNRIRSNKIFQNIQQVRDRMKEEAKVIEKCMRTNHASKNEYPVFDPRNYSNQGYPHCRTRISNVPKDFQFLRPVNVGFAGYDYRSGRCSYPVFEIRAESRSHRYYETFCK